MGIGSRPATCASCGTRLNRKQWYYREGKYFCKRHCWEAERAKLKQERADAQAKAATETQTAKAQGQAEAAQGKEQGKDLASEEKSKSA